MLRVLTWNVAGRVSAVPAQLEALATEPADVLALQEIRSTAAAAWIAGLRHIGYPHVLTALAPGPPDPDPSRRLGVLIAAAHPLERLAQPALPWPERYLAVEVAAPGGPVAVHDLHTPTSAREGDVKVRTIEAVARSLAVAGDTPAVVAGDFNTPQYESREGEVRSFARTRSGRIRAGFDERHDAAELSLVPGLAAHGFTDAFRAANGYGARDRSWMYAGRAFGYRLDHVFCRGLQPQASAYVHAWREAGLSDHSALWADLA